VSGLARNVLPPLPCRPSKLRFEVDTLYTGLAARVSGHVCEMMEGHREINELDLNAIILYPNGFVDARHSPASSGYLTGPARTLQAVFDAQIDCGNS
jgi:hypothetical protein